MSTFLDQTRARVPRLADAVQQRARLSVVSGSAQHAPRVPFAAFVLAVLGLGLVGLLVLNTSLQQGAFYAHSLEQRAEQLQERRAALALEVDALRAPDRVARKAQALGMLPNHNPAFLFLADGSVRGAAEPPDPAEALRLDPLDPVLAGEEVEKRPPDTNRNEPDNAPRRDRNRDTDVGTTTGGRSTAQHSDRE